MNEDVFFGKVVIVTGILWIIGFTLYLIFNKEEEKMESIDIFLGYTGGTIGVACFGPLLLCITLIIGIPTALISLLRGKLMDSFK